MLSSLRSNRFAGGGGGGIRANSARSQVGGKGKALLEHVWGESDRSEKPGGGLQEAAKTNRALPSVGKGAGPTFLAALRWLD